MIFGEISTSEGAGWILAHSVRFAQGAFKKGRLLTEADIKTLVDGGVRTIFAARLEADDVAEDEAAALMARALAGAHATAAEPFTGRANIYANTAGLARIDSQRIRRINHLHESLTVATLSDYMLVEARQMLATVKIIPFAVQRAVLDEAIAIAGEGEPPLSLAPLVAQKVGLVVTTLSQTKRSVLNKGIEAIGRRAKTLGSVLVEPVEIVAHDIAEVAGAIARLEAMRCDLILLLGASAIVDRGDILPMGLVAAGGTVLHLGMPVDPGNLMMLGRLADKPVVGVPTCARSPKLNGFDWVLQRILARLPVAATDIMDMGAGGLLMEIPTRPAPREGGEAPPINVQKAPRVTGIILAGGQSTRMGANNKLTMLINGKPMVRHVAEAALASDLSDLVVVVGHQKEAVREALRNLPVRIVDNPDFAQGMSTSLKAGLAALAPDSDAALICLGDMPLVAPRHINRLISAFNPAEGRTICVPCFSGKRGNPVLWGRTFFAEMSALAGDTGAKHLLGQYPEALCEVAMPDEAVLIDLDTRDALAAFTANA